MMKMMTVTHVPNLILLSLKWNIPLFGTMSILIIMKQFVRNLL